MCTCEHVDARHRAVVTSKWSRSGTSTPECLRRSNLLCGPQCEHADARHRAVVMSKWSRSGTSMPECAHRSNLLCGPQASLNNIGTLKWHRALGECLSSSASGVARRNQACSPRQRQRQPCQPWPCRPWIAKGQPRPSQALSRRSGCFSSGARSHA